MSMTTEEIKAYIAKQDAERFMRRTAAFNEGIAGLIECMKKSAENSAENSN